MLFKTRGRFSVISHLRASPFGEHRESLIISFKKYGGGATFNLRPELLEAGCMVQWSINECWNNDCRSYECRSYDCRSNDCRSNEMTLCQLCSCDEIQYQMFMFLHDLDVQKKKPDYIYLVQVYSSSSDSFAALSCN
jgi:hypothetical protein